MTTKAELVEIHDDAGWSLSLNFGKGDKARDRMRAFSNAYRTGQLVPREAVEAILAEIHDASPLGGDAHILAAAALAAFTRASGATVERTDDNG